MKVILSRKGFDSSAGGAANPIMPDGRLISMPIPDVASPVRYGDIQFKGVNFGDLARDLTRGKLDHQSGAHLDPDLHRDLIPRTRNWRPLFGQTGAAQGHLLNQQVGLGDLFLYFGWFRQCVMDDRGLRFEKGAPDLHLFFGWLQIGAIHDLNKQAPLSWMKKHPHCFGNRGKHNVLYVASEKLELPGVSGKKGAGLFPKVRPDRILTRNGRTRGIWDLPGWFHPEGRSSTLSYHSQPTRWSREGDGVILDSAKRGQDFVLDCDHYPEALEWARKIIC